jgi:hypothetical protein
MKRMCGRARPPRAGAWHLPGIALDLVPPRSEVQLATASPWRASGQAERRAAYDRACFTVMSPDIRAELSALARARRDGRVHRVRGGGEDGETWHLAGKMATKPNTRTPRARQDHRGPCRPWPQAHGGRRQSASRQALHRPRQTGDPVRGVLQQRNGLGCLTGRYFGAADERPVGHVRGRPSALVANINLGALARQVYAYARRRLRTRTARPAMPVPSSIRLVGSGTVGGCGVADKISRPRVTGVTGAGNRLMNAAGSPPP